MRPMERLRTRLAGHPADVVVVGTAVDADILEEYLETVSHDPDVTPPTTLHGGRLFGRLIIVSDVVDPDAVFAAIPTRSTHR